MSDRIATGMPLMDTDPESKGGDAMPNAGRQHDGGCPDNAAPLAWALEPQGDRYRNKLERAYAQHLEIQKRGGHIRQWFYESVTLVLAASATGESVRYTVDFLVLTNDWHWRCDEVKGFWTESALNKFRVARIQWPYFEWRAVKRIKGEWTATDSPRRELRRKERLMLKAKGKT